MESNEVIAGAAPGKAAADISMLAEAAAPTTAIARNQNADDRHTILREGSQAWDVDCKGAY